jgi:hypothetical protein
MSVVFADAFYFVARRNCRDQHHDYLMAFSPVIRTCIGFLRGILQEAIEDDLGSYKSKGVK